MFFVSFEDGKLPDVKGGIVSFVSDCQCRSVTTCNCILAVAYRMFRSLVSQMQHRASAGPCLQRNAKRTSQVQICRSGFSAGCLLPSRQALEAFLDLFGRFLQEQRR